MTPSEIERHQARRLRADVPARICATSSASRASAAVSLHEPLSNVRPVIFPEVRARRAAHRGVARRCTARRACAPTAARSSSRSATTSTRPTPTRCSGRWPIAPIRSRTCTWCRIAPAATAEVRPRAERRIAADRRHAEGAVPPLALPTREYMEHARKLWDELGLAGAVAAAAVARLHARRLERDLGDPLCQARRHRRLEKAAGNLRAEARRDDPETPVRDADKPGKGGH